MKKITLIFVLSSVVFSQYCNEESGWCYYQTPIQAFYMIDINNVSLDYTFDTDFLDDIL